MTSPRGSFDEAGRDAFASRDVLANGEGSARKWQTFGYTGRIPLKDIAPGRYLLRLEARERAASHRGNPCGRANGHYGEVTDGDGALCPAVSRDRRCCGTGASLAGPPDPRPLNAAAAQASRRVRTCSTTPTSTCGRPCELARSHSEPQRTTGKVHRFTMKSEDSKIYKGISRDKPGEVVPYERPVAVYIPAQYVPGHRCAVHRGAGRLQPEVPLHGANRARQPDSPEKSAGHARRARPARRRRRSRKPARPRIRHRFGHLHDVHRDRSAAENRAGLQGQVHEGSRKVARRWAAAQARPAR